MASNMNVFEINELFDDYKEIKRKMVLYNKSTKYQFSTGNSKTFESLGKLPLNYNRKLIYDEKYFKCQVNPKPKALKDFKDQNPGYELLFFFLQSVGSIN